MCFFPCALLLDESTSLTADLSSVAVLQDFDIDLTASRTSFNKFSTSSPKRTLLGRERSTRPLRSGFWSNFLCLPLLSKCKTNLTTDSAA